MFVFDIFVFFEGLLFGVGLFMLVGFKDVFVIKCLFLSFYLFFIVFVCVGSDVLLIVFGVYGLLVLLLCYVVVVVVVLWVGIVYFVGYGLFVLCLVIVGWEFEYVDGLCVVSEFMWLCMLFVIVVVLLFNLYVWIDMVLLFGIVIVSYVLFVCVLFVIGVMIVLLVWFLMFVYGVCVCCVWFVCMFVWCVFDGFVVVMMFGFVVCFVIDVF